MQTTETRGPLHRWLVALLFLGVFLSTRGYRSREGDQAYRLPILLHQQNPSVFAHDPFVTSFDAFNPHRGYLGLLDLMSRPFGLSFALAAVFGATFLITFFGIDRFARSVWRELGAGVGVVGAGLLFIAQAGNVGTNHLFEPILLDRLIAFGLGWHALGLAVGTPRIGLRLSPWVVGLAALIHPTVGVQLGLILGGYWAVYLLLDRIHRRETSPFSPAATGLAILSLGIAILPGFLLNLGQSGNLMEGLPADDFRLLSVELQGPQHMVPHLWRMPQWLAWGCYPTLAAIALFGSRGVEETGARRRLALLLAVNLLGLALAWYGVERLDHLRLTLFQPFRMATIARGLCLVAVAGHGLRLWHEGSILGRTRALLIAVGLTGDWSLVVVTAFEGLMSVADRAPQLRRVATPAAWVALAYGLFFLSSHDTESGHIPLLLTLAGTPLLCRVSNRQNWEWTPGRLARLTAYAWPIPLAALGANLVPETSPMARSAWRQGLVRLCRFGAVPIDDAERMALWCRANVPVGSRLIGPPGPKTLRLWSERDVAFNRAASPYNARGLGDWAARFADHVGLSSPPEALVKAYLTDRHGLERRYDAMTPAERAALADRQGAEYVVAPAPKNRPDAESQAALELIHVEGRYGLYRRNRADSPLANRAPANITRARR